MDGIHKEPNPTIMQHYNHQQGQIHMKQNIYD